MNLLWDIGQHVFSGRLPTGLLFREDGSQESVVHNPGMVTPMPSKWGNMQVQ